MYLINKCAPLNMYKNVVYMPNYYGKNTREILLSNWASLKIVYAKHLNQNLHDNKANYNIKALMALWLWVQVPPDAGLFFTKHCTSHLQHTQL